ncbi:hypothetical protein D3C86_1498520 [compost metagenome]
MRDQALDKAEVGLLVGVTKREAFPDFHPPRPAIQFDQTVELEGWNEARQILDAIGREVTIAEGWQGNRLEDAVERGDLGGALNGVRLDEIL